MEARGLLHRGLDLHLHGHRPLAAPVLQLEALTGELPERAQHRQQREGDEDAREPVDLAAGEQPEDHEQRMEPERAPITFGTTMWPSIWWIPRKSSVTQIADTGSTISA